MKFKETALAGCYIIKLEPYRDPRGWFARSFCSEEFEEIGFKDTWVQHNHSFTSLAGSVRGIHYQKMPAAETKLIRCIAGEIYDVAVDLRPNSKTYLKSHAEVLSSQNQNMIFIPKGFAHGFQTLTDNVELLYYHSEKYQPNHEGGLNYLDDELNIQWPLKITEISDRDKQHPFINSNFEGVNIK